MSQQYPPPTNGGYSHLVFLNILWKPNLLVSKRINRSPRERAKASCNIKSSSQSLYSKVLSNTLERSLIIM